MRVFVYYRIASRHATSALACAQALLADVAQRTGIVGELLHRPETDAQGFATWMEAYPRSDDSFADALAGALAASGLATYIEGERHVERFATFVAGTPPCA